MASPKPNHLPHLSSIRLRIRVLTGKTWGLWVTTIQSISVDKQAKACVPSLIQA